MSESTRVFCDLSVLPPSAQKQSAETLSQLLQAVREVEELPAGYALQFPNQPEMWMTLAHFVDRERQCCAFLHFVLEAEPNRGPFRLRITGSNEAKQFLKAAWLDLHGPAPASTA